MCRVSLAPGRLKSLRRLPGGFLYAIKLPAAVAIAKSWHSSSRAPEPSDAPGDLAAAETATLRVRGIEPA